MTSRHPSLHRSAARRSPMPRIVAALGAVLSLVLALAGCSGGAGAEPVPEPSVGVALADVDAVAVVAGATADTPAPALSPETTSILMALLDRQEPAQVSVVHVQAHPTLQGPDALKMHPIGGTAAGNAAVARGNLARVQAALRTPPAEDGADYLAAVTMAADALKAQSAAHPLVLVIGSGLSDTGALAFTPAGMIGADPTEVAAVVRTKEGATRLRGVTIVLSGTGWTAQPQRPLDDAQRTGVVEIVRTSLEAMGATTAVDPQPFTQTAVSTRRTVEPVALPAPFVIKPCVRQTLVYDQASAVRFEPDSTRFVDPQAAAAALEALADQLAAHPGETIALAGTTADDGSPLAAQKRLGKQRASTVADALVETDHLDRARITQVTGLGSDFPQYARPDRDAAGNLLPGPAGLNRSVRVVVTSHC